jgi:hypothetical protein
MKKVLKFSLVAVAALLFFVNITLNLNGGEVKSFSLSTNAQTAQADGWCYIYYSTYNCYCTGGGSNGYCAASCTTNSGGTCSYVTVEH